jgi:hypothetical protein
LEEWHGTGITKDEPTVIYLMKRMEFCETQRENIVLSDLDNLHRPTKIRLDPQTHSIKLMMGDEGYPLDADLCVVSPLLQPGAVRAWVGFQVECSCPKVDGVAVTSIGYRLHDGTSQWAWDEDHTEWTESAELWNTETEIAAHIATFDATATKKLRVMANLVTTDATVTPELKAILLAYQADLPSQQEDLIYRTVIPTLKTMRATTDFVTVSAGEVSIDLGAVMTAAEALHNVTGVEAVFDHTADSNHLTNLYSGYNATTKILTLTMAPVVGNTVFIRAIYQPEVIFETTGQDYTDVEVVPAIILSELNASRSTESSVDDAVVNKNGLTAFVYPAMARMMFDCLITTISPSGVDQQRLHEAIQRFFSEHTILRTTGTDEPFELTLNNVFTSTTQPSAGEAYTATASCRIENVYFQIKRTKTSTVDHVYPVGDLIFIGDIEATVLH